MSNISDKDLDKLFQEAAAGFNEPMDSDLWATMEIQLPSGDINGFVFYKVIGAVIISVIAILSLLIGTSGIDDKLTQEKEISQEATRSAEGDVKEVNTDKISRQQQQNLPHKADFNKENLASPQNSDIRTSAELKQEQTQSITPKESALKQSDKYFVDAGQTTDPEFIEHIGVVTDYRHYIPNFNLNLITESSEEQKEAGYAAFSVLVSYSPDLSSVGFFSPDKPGSNLGLLFSYQLSDRWGFSTGAILSRKIYYSNESESSYGRYNQDRTELDATCRVIDIPINAHYFFNRSDKSQFYFTTGLSSYFMLSEDYEFQSTNAQGTESWTTNYRNENNHYLGILNVGVGYERKIGHNLSLQLEPFLKVPLTGIGAGKVDLVSSGAFFNIKYQFLKQ
ncbi:PorT family protein [Fulvivirga sp. RKSG066]|uniref:outer membrane beta-barrel protein n=1 Tax=Fulvivirga aurantia TaxID=2529383 RepID=UPI0012BBA2D8|nr:outer membrane beta-barrel protein [Fulvivirga aurantia]MTI23051.1 PorT family protein [Fulvivirga aurantia]